jgi:hypothetical protein
MTKKQNQETNERKRPIWEDYVEKEVVCTLQSGTIVGKMKDPDLERNCMEFLPYLIQDANPEKARLEEETPRRVSLNLFGYDATYDIFTTYEGYTRDRVKEINKRAKSNGTIGFHSGR